MANKNIFKVDGEYIELMALLKAVGIAQTGGHAKIIVDDGNVLRNGEVELRRRAKCVISLPRRMRNGRCAWNAW